MAFGDLVDVALGPPGDRLYADGRTDVLEQALIQSCVGLSNHVDPRLPAEEEHGDVRWHRIELGPTDAALVPVGWWHHVEAMEPSNSVSFSGFRWPNQYPWYLPGGR